jgi:hypothetical protein
MDTGWSPSGAAAFGRSGARDHDQQCARSPETVTVSGKAAKSAAISWEGTQVTTSKNSGSFTFTTTVVPADCIGTLTDGVSTVEAAIAGCTVTPPPPPPTTSAFPATGQTSCWNGDGFLIQCGGTGQDGDVRAGAALSYTSNNDGTITDNNTGLVWEKKTTTCSGDIHCVSDIYTWANAFTNFITALNTPPCFAGQCDWRLPNIKELQSIMNFQNINPVVSAEFDNCAFGSCTEASGTGYWTSTSSNDGFASAMYASFFEGSVGRGAKGVAKLVRAVRGGV